MGHTPRTRENFPRMKDRAAGRRKRAQAAAQPPMSWGQIFASFTAKVDRFVVAVSALGRVISDVASRFMFMLTWQARRDREEIWSHRMLPATVSPWAAPIQCTEREETR